MKSAESIMPKSQRQWKSQNQQQALIEFDLVRLACPDGIYLCLTPGNFALWSGVLFNRKGPYAPAVLRFQLAFPQNYPAAPPLVLFTNDVFHPLVTPLTTYTYSTSLSTSGTVSATDEERLLPGGLNLRHGFPEWFKRETEVEPAAVDPDTPQNDREIVDVLESSGNGADADAVPNSYKLSRSIFLPPPKDESTSVEELYPTIVEVLQYIKVVFEDESILDELPLEVAANPGAWHAWHAHRKKAKAAKTSGESSRTQGSTPRKNPTSPGRPKPGSWNWDGVWSERVKKGVSSSLSDSMLYGGVDGDDLIHFLDLEAAAYDNLRRPFQAQEPSVS